MALRELFRSNKGVRYFVILSAAFFLFAYTIEHINGRFWLNDFKVYYLAAKAFLEHKTIYGVSFGLDSGNYKYAPGILIAFFPATLLNYGVAASVHFLFIAIATMGAFYALNDLVTRYWFEGSLTPKFLPLFFSFLAIAIQLVRELHLGNINMILLFLICILARSTLEKKYITAGILLAIVVMTKPYFALFLGLPLLLHKQYRTIFTGVIGGLVLLLLPAIFRGFINNFKLDGRWIHAMLNHSYELESYNTISANLLHIFGLHISPGASSVFVLVAIAAFSYIYLRNKTAVAGREINSNRNFLILYFSSLAIIPNLLVTDTEHFLLSLPVIFLLIYEYYYKSFSRISLIILIVILYLHMGTSADLLGKTLADKLDHAGILGISNLLLIAFFYWKIFTDQKKDLIAS